MVALLLEYPRKVIHGFNLHGKLHLQLQTAQYRITLGCTGRSCTVPSTASFSKMSFTTGCTVSYHLNIAISRAKKS